MSRFTPILNKHLGTLLLSLTLSACMNTHTTLTAPADEPLGSSPAHEVPQQVVLPPQEEDIFAINPDDYIEQPMGNIWDRVRAGFSIEEAEDHPRLMAELKWYAKHQSYLNRVADRATPFIHFVLEEAEKRNLPTELVLLPVVESAYQAFAYSHGRAAGIWQFIPSTGKIYGLKQNWWYDGRRDVYASTHAALKYLESLNREFKGDWLHALAAYNSGSGTVRRAIRKNKKRGKPTDFWNLDLPKETRAYVPKLLALNDWYTLQKAMK